MSRLLERNVFGQYILLKKLVMSAISMFFYPVFRWRNCLTVQGAERLRALPQKGVLFVSNHQTYFTDAICMHQIFSATLSGGRNSTRGLRYLVRPHDSLYYVAASETIASGIIARMLAYGSVVCVERTWKDGAHLIAREVDRKGVRRCNKINLPAAVHLPTHLAAYVLVPSVAVPKVRLGRKRFAFTSGRARDLHRHLHPRLGKFILLQRLTWSAAIPPRRASPCTRIVGASTMAKSTTSAGRG